MTRPHVQDYRYRLLTPERAHSVCEAWKAGVRAVDLARQYGVNVRTIYRYIELGDEPIETATVFGYRASFVCGEDGVPVRMTPWTPA